MNFFDSFLGLFSTDTDTDTDTGTGTGTGTGINSSIEIESLISDDDTGINPANGLPTHNGIDTAGNPSGFDFGDNFSCANDLFENETSIDTSLDSGIGDSIFDD